MINKITAGFGTGHYFKNYILNNNKKDNNSEVNNYSTMPQGLSLNYFVPFGASSSDSKNNQKSKLENILYYSDTPTKKLILKLKQEAKDDGFSNVTTLHVIKHAFNDVVDFIDNVNAGKEDAQNPKKAPDMVAILVGKTSDEIFTDKNLRNKLKEIIQDSNKNIDTILSKYRNEQNPQNPQNQDVCLSEDLTDAVWGTRKENETINTGKFIIGTLNSPDTVTSDFVTDFAYKISDLAMVDHEDDSNRVNFSAYENSAKKVLKNIALGTNTLVTYDPAKEEPYPFIDSIYNQAKKDGNKYSITEFNETVNPDYFNEVVTKLSQDKSKEHIIIADPIQMVLSSCMNVSDDGVVKVAIPDNLIKIFQNPPSNIKYVFYSSKDNYYKFANTNILSDFEEVTIPSLSTEQMIKAFKENPNMVKSIQKQFSKNALEKVVEASAHIDGVFPQKTINLMKKIVTYNIDKKEINEKDVSNYLKEATNLLKKTGDESSIEIIFDTGKKLKNIVGKESTKKEAASIVKQIKANKMGTKGLIIYSQDGSPGSGRRFTAKAIAGEAKVPYIEINTMDFGTKDVDIFGGGTLSPEASIKKLFSMVNTQAEANSHKSAVLFIENFEYFSVGELVSNYHQKAMAQLLREMDKADKNGLNILVVGSVSNPSLIGEAAMKSFKFVDSVEVSSPAYNKDERAEIIKQALKDNKLKLAGNSEDKKNTINVAANISEYFPFIYLKNLVKKASTVANERGHKALTKYDFIEAYLRITTGRPAINHIEEHDKKVTTSHECGHATNLEVMNNLSKTLGRPWHIPDKVNFITLDPRSFYGGAVYHGDDANTSRSFENLFASLVCSFGGNSAEKRFFDMDGSYGISCDMKSVRACADLMVKSLGMGANTGKMVINKNEVLSDDLRSLVEKDERVIIHNAKIVSDLITEIYSDFNKKFTEKYSPLVGTGECLIEGADFKAELNKWKAEQTPEKQRELKLCDETIMKIIEATKKGIAVQKED